jgi:hypothetical protein
VTSPLPAPESVESVQLDAPVVDAPAVDAPAVDTPTVDTPPRAVWTSVPPATAWCPAEWREHLDAVAPGLAEPTSLGESETLGEHVNVLLLASKRGKLHAHRGEHREDAGSIVALRHGWCAAVADGAGSAPYSRLGSAIATHVFTRSVEAALATPATQPGHDALTSAMQHAASAANAAMRDFALRTGLAHRDLRTTLLAAALHHNMLATMQVGDGAMTLRHAAGHTSHPHAAATGDYSGEVAHFLPDDGALDQLHQSLAVQQRDDCVAVLLATDGVEDPWYPFTRYAEPLFAQLADGTIDSATLPSGLTPAWRESVLHAANPVQALTHWLGFEKRGENDDRTLCVIWLAP